MDQREHNLQPLGICYRLYHFIKKTLASQALKTVTLGRDTRYGSCSTALRGLSSKEEKLVRIEDDGRKNGEGKNDPCMKGDEMASANKKLALPTRNEAKTPKKMVSINENVEILPMPSKKRKRSKSFQKSSSMDQEEEEEPKPLRSILKVGSDLNDKSNPVC